MRSSRRNGPLFARRFENFKIMNFWIVPSLQDVDTYFLFRAFGEEIKVEIDDGVLYSNKYLKPEERRELHKRVYAEKLRTIDNQIIELHHEGLTDLEISAKLKVGTATIQRVIYQYWKTKIDKKIQSNNESAA